MGIKALLHVRINSPDKVMWEGEAESMSSVNSEGPFDILPYHANFITVVEGKPIRIKTEKEIVEFTYQKAIVYIHSNTVSIYVNL